MTSGNFKTESRSLDRVCVFGVVAFKQRFFFPLCGPLVGANAMAVFWPSPSLLGDEYRPQWKITAESHVGTAWHTKQLNVLSTEPLSHHNWFTPTLVVPKEKAHSSAARLASDAWITIYSVGSEATWFTSLNGKLLFSHISVISNTQAPRYSCRYLTFAVSSPVFLLRDWALIGKQVGKGSRVFIIFSLCRIPPFFPRLRLCCGWWEQILWWGLGSRFRSSGLRISM